MGALVYFYKDNIFSKELSLWYHKTKNIFNSLQLADGLVC